jgi:hypothetical protein
VDCGVMGNRRAVDYLSEVQRCMGRMRGNSYPSGNILSINLELFRGFVEGIAACPGPGTW